MYSILLFSPSPQCTLLDLCSLFSHTYYTSASSNPTHICHTITSTSFFVYLHSTKLSALFVVHMPACIFSHFIPHCTHYMSISLKNKSCLPVSILCKRIRTHNIVLLTGFQSHPCFPHVFLRLKAPHPGITTAYEHSFHTQLGILLMKVLHGASLG